MALSTVAANLAWMQVDSALLSLSAKPAYREELRQLKAYLSQNKSNPDLQVVFMANVTAAANVINAACTIYAIYMKKQATATAAYPRMNDNASTTVGGSNGSNMTDVWSLPVTGQELLVIYNTGRKQSNGIAVESATTAAGGTDSTSGDGPNMFFVFGS